MSDSEIESEKEEEVVKTTQYFKTSFGTAIVPPDHRKLKQSEIIRNEPLPPMVGSSNVLGGNIDINRDELATYYQLRQIQKDKEKREKREEIKEKERLAKVNKGVSQFRKKQYQRNLKNVDEVREKMGLPTKPVVKTNEDIREQRLKRFL